MGRKKKPGEREPNGKPSRTEEAKRMRRFAVWQRRWLRPIVANKEELLDPHYGHIVGVLERLGVLSSAQYDAAVLLQKAVNDWRKVMHPAPPLVAQELGRVKGASADIDADRAAEAKRRLADMTRELVELDPTRRMPEINPYVKHTFALAVRGEVLGQSDRIYAERGLAKLASVFIHRGRAA